MLGLGLNFGSSESGSSAARMGGDAASLLIDTYTGATLALSLRHLNSSYTGNAINVRRAGDDVEAAIGFSNGVLDTSALAAHCGSSDGFVDTWYDQSGNGRDMVQETAANQPKIYTGSAVITENGKPIVLGGINAFMNGATFSGASAGTIFSVIKRNFDGNLILSYNGNPYFLVSGDGDSSSALDNVSGGVVWYKNGASAFSGSASRDDVYTATGSQVSITATCNTSQFGQIDLGYTPAPNLYPMYSMQELVVYNTDRADRGDIESNINTFYSIY